MGRSEDSNSGGARRGHGQADAPPGQAAARASLVGGWRCGAVLPGDPGTRQRPGHGPRHGGLRAVRAGRERRLDRHAGICLPPRRYHGRGPGGVRPAGAGHPAGSPTGRPGRPQVAERTAGGRLRGAGAGDGRGRRGAVDRGTAAGRLQPRGAGQHRDGDHPPGPVHDAARAGSRCPAGDRRQCGRWLGRERGDRPGRPRRRPVPRYRADRHAVRGQRRFRGRRGHPHRPGAGVWHRAG